MGNWARDGFDLDEGDGDGGVEKWLELGYIL